MFLCCSCTFCSILILGIAEDEVWNVLHSQPPVPDCLTVNLNPEGLILFLITKNSSIKQIILIDKFILVKQMVLQMREKLYQLLTFFNNFKFLDCEAAVLSRILYRNYRALKKDKGFQLLKMVSISPFISSDFTVII